MNTPRQVQLGALSVSIAAGTDGDALFAALAQLSHAAQAMYEIAARAGSPAALCDGRLFELLAAYEGIRVLLDLADMVEQAVADHDDEAPAAPCAQQEVPLVH